MADAESAGGFNTICGSGTREYRRALPGKSSQRMSADLLQTEGLNVGRSAIQRIESGKRLVIAGVCQGFKGTV